MTVHSSNRCSNQAVIHHDGRRTSKCVGGSRLAGHLPTEMNLDEPNLERGNSV